MARLVGWRGRRGIAAVEAAIFIPLLILIVLGLIEYGWLFLRLQCVNNAAREGVRVAVRHNATPIQVTNAISAVMNGCGMATYTTPMLPDVNAVVGDQITCKVQVVYDSIADYTLLPVPPVLMGTATMMKEAP